MTKIEVEDNIDNKSIDQLHAVVLQLSSNCFELKKLCATLIITASTLIITLSEKVSQFEIGTPKMIFMINLLIIVSFWVLDSQSFHYQQKIRLTMRNKAQRILDRSGLENIHISGVGMPADSDVGRNIFIDTFRAMFNQSMTFYLIVLILVIFVIIFT